MTEKKQQDSVFSTLNAINCNEHTEKKKQGSTELTYLSWPWAWAEVKKRYPNASYTIYKDENNRPYIEDTDYGIICYTTVTIEEQTHEMWLPVMNGANKAMRRVPYQYQVWNAYNKQYETKTVEAATMFDINKTIMRCLVKNLAMFGLGLYIYAGEDIPESEGEQVQATPAPQTAQAHSQVPLPVDGTQDMPPTNAILKEIKGAKTKEQLTEIYYKYPQHQRNAGFTGALTARKDQINNNGKS